MRFDEALKYQDSLDAVEAGIANSAQAAEAEAVVVGIRAYIAAMDGAVAEFKNAYAALNIFGDRADAARKAIDGDAVLTEPRISVAQDGSVVVAKPIEITPLVSPALA